MSNQHERPEQGGDSFHVEGGVKGSGIAIGRGASAHASGNVYQEGNVTIDRAALKSSLMDLYEYLGASSLPLKQKMALQLATGRAAELAEEQELQAQAVTGQIKQMGETFQSAGEAIDAGSQLGHKILNIARIVAPLVGGGARIVASWFGLPLP